MEKLNYKSDVIKHSITNFDLTIKTLLYYVINNQIQTKYYNKEVNLNKSSIHVECYFADIGNTVQINIKDTLES